MANPFPSDWSLDSPKEQPAPPARPPLALLRNLSVQNALSYCSQILSRFSLDSSSSSPPALESSLSTRDSSGPPSPITPVTPGGKRYTRSAATCSAFLPLSPRAKRQRSAKEMRNLSDSLLGLQLAIILPEEHQHQDLYGSLPPSALPAVASSRPSPHICPRMVLRHSEGPFGDAIPDLDLNAVQEGDEEEDDACIGGFGGGAEAPAAAAPEAEASGEAVGYAVRLNAASRRRSELARYAGRFVAPRDLLFL